MSAPRSVVDTLLVARFEVLRAVRTWRALALVVLYVVANVGGAYLFIEALAQLESQIAHQLHVPATRWPGPLMDQVRHSDELLRMLSFFVGGEEEASALLDWPLLAIYQLWQGFLLVPFLAATAASEAVAIDVQSRAIRFEALRTGRPELVAGRFLGQIGLAAVATLAALVGVWVLGMALMVKQDPAALAGGLLLLGSRSLVYALPFAGLGVACSSVTGSPGWARVLSLVLVAGSWVAFGVLTWAAEVPWSTVADALLPLFPQSWLDGLWRPGGDLLVSAAVLAALSVVAVGAGYAAFARRDL